MPTATTKKTQADEPESPVVIEKLNPQAYLVGTAWAEQTVQIQDYSPLKIGFRVEFPIYLDGDPEERASQVLAEYRHAILYMKAAIWDELGVPYEMNDEKILVPLVRRTFGSGVTAEQSSPELDTNVVELHPDRNSQSAAEAPPYTADEARGDKDKMRARTEWAKARHQTHPHEFWDNRADKVSGKAKSTSFDFKHKDSGAGFWVS